MHRVRQWFGATTGGLPRGFWYIWTNMLINRIGSFVLILLALYLTGERHFTPAFAGFVIGLWGAGGAGGTLVGGILADRWGRKPTFLTAMYSSAGLMVLLGLARGPVAVALTVLALGFASEAARPAMSALMIDIVPAADRLRAFSLNYWAINLGFSLAAVTAGFVANVSFMLVFLGDALTTVLAATLIWLKVAETRPARVSPKATPAPADGRGPGLRVVFRDRVFLSYVGINVLTAMVFMQHLSTLPIAMGHDGLSPATYGLVIALNGVLIVVGQLFVPALLRGRSHASSLALAAIVLGVGFGVTAFAHTAWLYAGSVLVWTLGEMLNAPSNSATNAELSPLAMRGRYQGVFSLSWSAAGFLAPIIGAATFQYFGGATLWVGCFVVGCLVAGLHLWAGPARERRAAELASAAGPTVAATSPGPASTTAPTSASAATPSGQ